MTVQVGLCQSWSETLKTDFQASRLNGSDLDSTCLQMASADDTNRMMKCFITNKFQEEVKPEDHWS